MDPHYPFMPPEEFTKQVSTEGLSKSRISSLNGKMHEWSGDLMRADLDDLRTLYRADVRYTDPISANYLTSFASVASTRTHS